MAGDHEHVLSARGGERLGDGGLDRADVGDRRAVREPGGGGGGGGTDGQRRGGEDHEVGAGAPEDGVFRHEVGQF